MRIIESPDEIAAVEPEKLVLTVGNFDGLHLGHRAVFSELVSSAESRGGHSVAVTFDPHPFTILRPDSAPALLTPLNEKIALMGATDIGAALVVSFTRDVAATRAIDFLSWLGVRRGAHMVLGYDFHMGRDRSCDVGRLSEIGAVLGYGLDVVPPIEYRGGAISSSRIRESLAGGDVEATRDMLGRPYALSGRVVAGGGVGRLLGSPTANLSLPAQKQLPADGVYYVTSHTPEGRPGLLYVGSRPTFGAGERGVEVHLLDLDRDLTGETLRVSIHRRLRGERRFADRSELSAAIGRDIEAARALAREAGSGGSG